MMFRTPHARWTVEVRNGWAEGAAPLLTVEVSWSGKTGTEWWQLGLGLLGFYVVVVCDTVPPRPTP